MGDSTYIAGLSDDLPKRILSNTFLQALLDAGVVRRGDYVRRVVIDAEVGKPVIVHLERIGDERLLQVVRTLEGVEIREEPRRGDELTG